MKYIIATLFLFITSLALGDGFNVGLGGYCPVGFVKAGKAVYGDPKFASKYHDVVYYNSSQEAKSMFDKDPESFLSEMKFDGYCATGLSMGKKIKSDPTILSKIDGKVYFFSSQGAKDMFDKNPKEMIKKAEESWKKESK